MEKRKLQTFKEAEKKKKKMYFGGRILIIKTNF